MKTLEYMPLTTGKKKIFLRIIDIRIENFTKHPHLYKQPTSCSVKSLKRKMEKLHSKYVFAPADIAANNMIIIWIRYCGWFNFRRVPIFVVFVEGPIHEF